MREASLSDINTGFTFTCQFQGQAWLQVAHVPVSQAGCLGLLTVEKRMLWLECCGVNSGEHSSQRWLIAGGAQLSRGDKVASVCHMVAYYMLSHQLITLRWKWAKHPNMKHIGGINAQLHVLALSHAILVMLSAAWNMSVSQVPHMQAVLSLPLTAEWLQRRCFPGELQPNHAGEITVWSCSQLLLWFLYPASHNYVFLDV